MRSVCKILIAWLGVCLMPSVAIAQATTPAIQEIDNTTCKTCHVAYEGHKVNSYHSDCKACHSVIDPKHLVEGGKGRMKFPASENCLSCHQNNDHKRMNWAFSSHKQAQVECRDCHGMHSPKQPKQFNLALWKTDKKSAACMDCHQDVAARLNMPSHHPVKEGALSCVSCHDPHGGKQTSLTNKNDQCYKCHQAIRGPKVFEHAPVVEDCTICHNPHGSPNRRLLQIAQPMQCLQCHSITNNRHATAGVPNGAQLRNCTNCHGAIHGSHIDARLKH